MIMRRARHSRCMSAGLLSAVTLQVPRNRRLRCQSYVNVTAADLFPLRARQKYLQPFLDLCGRVEVIWFPFTEKPWLKVWKQEDSFPKCQTG